MRKWKNAKLALFIVDVTMYQYNNNFNHLRDYSFKEQNNMKKYDYLIVGAGLFGSTFAYEATKCGKSCLVIDKRDKIGGNIRTDYIDDIVVHTYGPHIFHTSDEKLWKYVNSFAEFNNFINRPLANYNGKIYNLPFNMNTFCKIWPEVSTPQQAMRKIKSQTSKYDNIIPQNLEEQALQLVGRDIYEILIKEYTEKQWGRPCTELPASIIRRLPLRFTFDNNYFNDTYQGVPVGGYSQIIKKMLEKSDVITDISYKQLIKQYGNVAKKVIYTGPIDEFFDYQYGRLEFRTVTFKTTSLDMKNFQGNAVVNYTSSDSAFTRIIEHKWFDVSNQPTTVISMEYPCEWEEGKEPFYPISDRKNLELLKKYQELAEKRKDVIFGGRLGEYKYYDMDKCIEAALALVKKELY